MPLLTVVILVRNEAIHIERALASVAGVADRCYVVDSGSTDNTVPLATAAGAHVIQREWVNYSTQFNWAIQQLPDDTEWVMRLDADEIVTESLAREIRDQLALVPLTVSGINVSRRMCFMGRVIRWGGVFPVRVVRLFRYGRGHIENRWMDEHVIVDGPIWEFWGEVLDDNRNSLGWWTEKHNKYAAREVVDLINLEHNVFSQETVADLGGKGGQAGRKRWIKERLYARLPIGLRAFSYFIYRFVIRLGFLDGSEGRAFHVLQGFWYRYLVDMKLHEVRQYMKTRAVGPKEAIRDVLGIEV